MTALFPKVAGTGWFVSRILTGCIDEQYINIRRGQIVCPLIGGWAFVPWKILAKFATLEAFRTTQTQTRTHHIMIKCSRVLELHEWIHYFPGTVHRDHGHGRSFPYMIDLHLLDRPPYSSG